MDSRISKWGVHRVEFNGVCSLLASDKFVRIGESFCARSMNRETVETNIGVLRYNNRYCQNVVLFQ
jgi:hypothetical protein